jgi:hypothetical protein
VDIPPGSERFQLVDVNDGNLSPGDPFYKPGLPDDYRSGLFINTASGQPVFVTSGTNLWSGADWYNNFAQGLGFIPPQYQQALSDGQRYVSQYPNLIVTGHSLGGGLATFVGGMTGIPTTTFNPAGLGGGTLTQMGQDGLPLRPGQFEVYVVEGEALTGLSTYIGQPAPFGNIHVLPKNPDGNPLSNHQMSVGVLPGLAAGENKAAGYTAPPRLPPTFLLP